PVLPGVERLLRSFPFEGRFRCSRLKGNGRQGSSEQCEGTSLRREPMLPRNPARGRGVGGREAKFPGLRGAGRRHDAAEVFMMSVEEKKDAIAFSRTAPFIVFVQHAAREVHAETADKAAVPIGLGHFTAFNVPPEHLLGKTWTEGFTGEEVFAAKNGIFGTDHDQL